MRNAANISSSNIFKGLTLPTDQVLARRRGKIRGHLRKKGPSWIGSWAESERLPDGTLRWRTRVRKICPLVDKGRPVTRKMAQRLLDEQYLDDVNRFNLFPRALRTLKEFWEEKFAPTLATKKPKTKEHYEVTWRSHLEPFIGDMRMREIDLDTIQQLIYNATSRKHPGRKKGEVVVGYSPQSLIHIRNMLTTMFKKARKLKWYTGELPTDGVELPTFTRVREKHALTPDQAVDVMEGLADQPRPVQEFVRFMQLSGVRVGEATGLRWKNVNLSESEWKVVEGIPIQPKTVAIRDNFVLGKFQTVKRDASARIVPLAGPLFEALVAWQKETEFSDPDSPVFHNKSGRPLDHHNIANRVLKPLGIKLGIPWLTWHVFRHTANTTAAVVGGSVAQRKKIFGWTEDQMAMHYDQSGTREMEETMRKIGDYLTGNLGNSK